MAIQVIRAIQVMKTPIIAVLSAICEKYENPLPAADRCNKILSMQSLREQAMRR